MDLLSITSTSENLGIRYLGEKRSAAYVYHSFVQTLNQSANYVQIGNNAAVLFSYINGYPI
jgi:hypothetical protein